MSGFWYGISLIIATYLAILFISEPIAQMIGIGVVPVSFICLIIGIIIGNLISLPFNWVRGINYIKQNILQIAIIFLGLKISLAQVFKVGLGLYHEFPLLKIYLLRFQKRKNILQKKDK